MPSLVGVKSIYIGVVWLFDVLKEEATLFVCFRFVRFRLLFANRVCASYVNKAVRPGMVVSYDGNAELFLVGNSSD